MYEGDDSCGGWIDEPVNVDWSGGEPEVRRPKFCGCGCGHVMYTVVHKAGGREFACEACQRCVADTVSVLISCGATEVHVYNR